MSSGHAAIVFELGVNGLGAVRSLAKEGVDVIGIYTDIGPGCYSKYCRSIEFPKIGCNEKLYLEKLLGLCRELETAPVLIPSSDESVQFISKYRDVLNEVSLFSMPSQEIIDKIIEKGGTRDLASSFGVKIPKTYIPQSDDDLKKIIKEIRFPVILKPDDTFSVKLPNSEKNILFNSNDSLNLFFKENKKYYSECVLQEVITSGDGHIFITAGYYDHESKPIIVYSGRKIRQYLPDYGVTSYGISEYREDLIELSNKFMADIQYSGLVALEFAQDKETGEMFFIEANARSYYHNSLFMSCGMNLPYAAYLNLIGDKYLLERINKLQKNGISWIDFNKDFGSFYRKFKKNEITLKKWLFSVAQARSFAVFSTKDIRPWFYSMKQLIRILLSQPFER